MGSTLALKASADETLSVNIVGILGIYHYGGSGWRWTHEALFKYDRMRKGWLLKRVKENAFNNFIEGEDGLPKQKTCNCNNGNNPPKSTPNNHNFNPSIFLKV